MREIKPAQQTNQGTLSLLFHAGNERKKFGLMVPVEAHWNLTYEETSYAHLLFMVE